MSVSSRARSATRWGLKMQRRIVLTQALFWPVLVTVGMLGAGAVVMARKRNAGAAESAPLPQTPAAMV